MEQHWLTRMMNFVLYFNFIAEPVQCFLSLSASSASSAGGWMNVFARLDLKGRVGTNKERGESKPACGTHQLFGWPTKNTKNTKKGLNCPSLISCHLTVETNGQIEGKSLEPVGVKINNWICWEMIVITVPCLPACLPVSLLGFLLLLSWKSIFHQLLHLPADQLMFPPVSSPLRATKWRQNIL